MERRIGWRIWRSMVEREVFVLMLFGRNSRRRFEFLLFYFLRGDLGCRKLHLVEL